MKTIKQYAEMKGVSHQSVYKMLQTHKDELEPHIVTQGRTRYLTDEAVVILESYRESNPVIIDRTNDKERIDELENTIKQMLIRENELQREIAENNKELRRYAELRAEQAEQIATAEANKILLEQKVNENQELRHLLETERQRANQAEADLDAEQSKTWWDKLLKR